MKNTEYEFTVALGEPDTNGDVLNFAARYSKMWLSGKSVYLKHLNSALDKIEKALYNS